MRKAIFIQRIIKRQKEFTVNRIRKQLSSYTNFECVWLIELSDINLTGKQEFFKPIKIKQIVIFMIINFMRGSKAMKNMTELK